MLHFLKMEKKSSSRIELVGQLEGCD